MRVPRFLAFLVSDLPTMQARRDRAEWARKKAIIRANRIRKRPVHDYRRKEGVIMMQHGFHPAHCVCNGTHVHGSYCPRCPQPYWIAQQVRFL